MRQTLEAQFLTSWCLVEIYGNQKKIFYLLSLMASISQGLNTEMSSRSKFFSFCFLILLGIGFKGAVAVLTYLYSVETLILELLKLCKRQYFPLFILAFRIWALDSITSANILLGFWFWLYLFWIHCEWVLFNASEQYDSIEVVCFSLKGL